MYWEKRKEVFGPEKFTMRMTLSEALCDDLVALEVGFFQLLPKLDSSGRQLMLLTPAYHNKEGYTSDSLVSTLLACVGGACDTTLSHNYLC